ncbi:MAG: 23S rRNA (uracil(1939)-C(5))-methyltransferase RlmD, partial [Candidatus Eremiobacteraeota bacterium]|nr:23S rRNA (uracil(1939)-C(5))-methyltransferase RlmD [Candidatus Eremiobacteraeota bacterium]
EYRNKMSLVVDHRENSTGFGFYKQRSHDIVPITHCPIVQPALNDSIRALIELRADAQAAQAFQSARHVVGRASLSSQENIVAITTPARDRNIESLSAAMLQRFPHAAGIVESYDLRSENAILGRRIRTTAGKESIEETVGGLRFKLSAGSFFQVNIEILERIFDALALPAEKSRRIVDLYCGSGTFALHFARHACEVFGVEENARAISEARDNAELNSLTDRVTFEVGRVEDVLLKPSGSKKLHAADAVFLDPPRKGVEARALSAIAEAGVASIWYLSCDPATLARDLKFLLPKGYRLDGVQPIDMFPQTGHIESLAFLSREK